MADLRYVFYLFTDDDIDVASYKEELNVRIVPHSGGYLKRSRSSALS